MRCDLGAAGKWDMLFAKRRRRLARVLVVEDEPLVAFEAEHLLSESGFEIVATVDTVAAALGFIHSGVPIDLVLTDLTLADGDGVHVAHAAVGLGLPVLFVTGHPPGEAEALAAGWLGKPHGQRDLVHAIDAIEAALAGTAPKRMPPSFTLFVTIEGGAEA